MTPFEKLKAERDAVRQFKDAIKAKRQALSDLETEHCAKMSDAVAATIRVAEGKFTLTISDDEAVEFAGFSGVIMPIGGPSMPLETLKALLRGLIAQGVISPKDLELSAPLSLPGVARIVDAERLLQLEEIERSMRAIRDAHAEACKAIDKDPRNACQESVISEFLDRVKTILGGLPATNSEGPKS